jgi:hypothetical protein
VEADKRIAAEMNKNAKLSEMIKESLDQAEMGDVRVFACAAISFHVGHVALRWPI